MDRILLNGNGIECVRIILKKIIPGTLPIYEENA
jgi:hypothetical protein